MSTSNVVCYDNFKEKLFHEKPANLDSKDQKLETIENFNTKVLEVKTKIKKVKNFLETKTLRYFIKIC